MSGSVINKTVIRREIIHINRIYSETASRKKLILLVSECVNIKFIAESFRCRTNAGIQMPFAIKMPAKCEYAFIFKQRICFDFTRGFRIFRTNKPLSEPVICRQ